MCKKNCVIITHSIGHNYGGIMQAYALQRVVNKLFKNTVSVKTTISFAALYPDGISINDDRDNIRFLSKKNPNYQMNYAITKQSENTRKFIFKNMNVFDFFDGMSIPPQKNIDETDIFIVGSDQVFSEVPLGWKSVRDSMYLAFLNDEEISKKKCIVYAGSFGSNKIDSYYDREDIEEYGKLLRRFDAVSIREGSGVKICEDKFDVCAIQLLDPTFLVERSMYKELFKGSKYRPKKFSYILDPRFERFERFENLIAGQEWNGDAEPLLPVEDWLSAIYHAEQVITDSFHGMVFAMLFHTPFVAIINKQRGSERFLSLAQQFGLYNRVVDVDGKTDAYVKAEIMERFNYWIDWESIDSKKEELSEHSIEWLKENLGV